MKLESVLPNASFSLSIPRALWGWFCYSSTLRRWKLRPREEKWIDWSSWGVKLVLRVSHLPFCPQSKNTDFGVNRPAMYWLCCVTWGTQLTSLSHSFEWWVRRLLSPCPVQSVLSHVPLPLQSLKSQHIQVLCPHRLPPKARAPASNTSFTPAPDPPSCRSPQASPQVSVYPLLSGFATTSSWNSVSSSVTQQ